MLWEHNIRAGCRLSVADNASEARALPALWTELCRMIGQQKRPPSQSSIWNQLLYRSRNRRIRRAVYPPPDLSETGSCLYYASLPRSPPVQLPVRKVLGRKTNTRQCRCQLLCTFQFQENALLVTSPLSMPSMVRRLFTQCGAICYSLAILGKAPWRCCQTTSVGGHGDLPLGLPPSHSGKAA